MKKAKRSPIIVEQLSTERLIAEMQLERLKAIAMERLLTYEETKIFDLLTKNLFLAKGEATTVVGSSQRLEDARALPEDTLIKLAQTVDEKLMNKSLEFIDDDESKPKT